MCFKNPGFKGTARRRRRKKTHLLAYKYFKSPFLKATNSDLLRLRRAMRGSSVWSVLAVMKSDYVSMMMRANLNLSANYTLSP